MNLLELATNCSSHQYCTSCPSRGDCCIRENFYNENKYNTALQFTNTMLLARCFANRLSYEETSLTIHRFNKKMYEKRQREMELHPEYSPE